jgi:hypothetical protein
MQYSVRKGESFRNDCCHSALHETSHPLHALWAKDWHVGKLLIELARVRLPLMSGFMGCNFSIRKFIPQNLGKENVSFDIFGTFGPLPSLLVGSFVSKALRTPLADATS